MKFYQNVTTQTPLICSLLGGMLYASGFPMIIGHSFFAGPILGFFLFNYALSNKEDSLKKQMLKATLFSFGFYLLGFYWIPYTLMEFGGLFFPLNHLLGFIFSLVIIPQIYIYTLIQRKYKNIIFLAISYVLLEEYIPQQFPAHLGHSMISLTPEIPLRLAPFFGASVYSFLAVFIALTALDHHKNKKIPFVSYGLIVVMILFNFILPAPYKGPALSALNIRIVQPNIGNFLKIDSEKGGANSLKNVFDNYIELSTAPSVDPLDLIIWPETAFPTLIFSEMLKQNPDHLIEPTIKKVIEKTQSELFFGGYDFKPSKGFNDLENQYNSAFHFGSDQKLKEVYHKMHLIPFGEGLPFGPLNSTLKNYITNISYFAEGDKFVSFETKSGIPFISVICYEILFSDFIRDFLNNQKVAPQFLINLTNDSWYGDTAEPHQHLFLAKWRALEFNLPFVRSTNTGITTFIDQNGAESNRLTFQEKKYLDLKMKIFARTDTPFQRFGLWPILGLALTFFVIKKRLKKLGFE
jgi:apolipoprotein N-acyltransferase